MAPILTRTPLASISFQDNNGSHIRVYYQDTSGNIRETFYDDNRGWQERPENVVGRGKLNTGIAVTQWANGTQIRVYYISPENTLVERAYEGGRAGGWSDGSLTRANIRAAPYSQIGAVPFSLGQHDARVHYQREDNKIGEAVLDASANRWSSGDPTFPVAIPGSNISAISSTDRQDQRVWVYYQKADTQLVEYQLIKNHGWKVGGYKPEGVFPPLAGLSAVHFGDYHIRVYAINENNELLQTRWDKDSGWGKTEPLYRGITFSSVASIHLRVNDDWLRVYVQPSGQTISELGSNDGGESYITTQDSIPVDR